MELPLNADEKKPTYLFISRKSSHYRYYQKIVDYLDGNAELRKLKTLVFPRLSQWHKVNKLDINDLVDVHMKRKQVRHPLLKNNVILRKLVRKFYEFREKSRASYYFSLFQKHPCETVVMWNGMKQPNRTPYVVAKAAGKKTQLFENGLLPHTTVLDAKGVNAMNSLPRNSDFYRDWEGESSNSDKQLVVRAPHKNRKAVQAEIELPERYVFVPFQVPNDTQIVCHSPWVEDMDAFYQALESALQYLQQQAQWQGFKFVIKEHPSWPRSFTHLHQRNPDIIFANNNNTQSLVENAIAVVTINSTVGIEALLLEKAVITLGNAFFNIDGLVEHCKDQTSFNQALLQIEQKQVDLAFVEKFLSYVRNEYSLPQSWNNLSEPSSHFAAVKQRLEQPYQPETKE